MAFTQRPPITVTQSTAPIEVVYTAPASDTTVSQTAIPTGSPLEITKFQFRQLFTMDERIAIDNAEFNLSLSGRVKATLATFMKDVEVSNVVVLNSPEVITGIQFLVANNLLTATRAIQVLANQQP